MRSGFDDLFTSSQYEIWFNIRCELGSRSKHVLSMSTLDRWNKTNIAYHYVTRAQIVERPIFQRRTLLLVHLAKLESLLPPDCMLSYLIRYIYDTFQNKVISNALCRPILLSCLCRLKLLMKQAFFHVFLLLLTWVCSYWRDIRAVVERIFSNSYCVAEILYLICTGFSSLLW